MWSVRLSVYTHSLHKILRTNNKLHNLQQASELFWKSGRGWSAKLVSILRVEGVAWSAQRIPTAVNFGVLDRCSYFFIPVALQLSSRGWVGPVPDTLLVRQSGSAGNRTRDLWIFSQKFWLLNHRGGEQNIAGNFKKKNKTGYADRVTYLLRANIEQLEVTAARKEHASC
jgi:hypothetical protein